MQGVPVGVLDGVGVWLGKLRRRTKPLPGSLKTSELSGASAIPKGLLEHVASVDTEPAGEICRIARLFVSAMKSVP